MFSFIAAFINTGELVFTDKNLAPILKLASYVTMVDCLDYCQKYILSSEKYLKLEAFEQFIVFTYSDIPEINKNNTEILKKIAEQTDSYRMFSELEVLKKVIELAEQYDLNNWISNEAIKQRIYTNSIRDKRGQIRSIIKSTSLPEASEFLIQQVLEHVSKIDVTLSENYCFLTDFQDVEELFSVIYKKFEENISLANFKELWEFASRDNEKFSSLKEACIAFLLKQSNQSKILLLWNFKDVPQELIQAIKEARSAVLEEKKEEKMDEKVEDDN